MPNYTTLIIRNPGNCLGPCSSESQDDAGGDLVDDSGGDSKKSMADDSGGDGGRPCQNSWADDFGGDGGQLWRGRRTTLAGTWWTI